MSNSPTGRDGGAFPNLEKPKSGGIVPGSGIPLAAMVPLFGEHVVPAYVSAPRATPRSATMASLPGESYFTIADRFIAPFLHISLRALDRIIPALDRHINARQRRRIRRQIRRDIDAMATRILETGRP